MYFSQRNQKYVKDIIIDILQAPGQSYVRKAAHLQVVRTVWGTFNNTNRYLFTSTILYLLFTSQGTIAFIHGQ